MAGYVVSDIMSRNPITLSEEDNLENIAQGMEEFHLRHLPVVDGHKLVGLVSHRDILR
ncbi:MAG: CBS domain-containing protein, partial [Polyangiales bacterium]